MKALIVGGTGFVGHHVVNKLIKLGHEVSILVRNLTNTVPRDVAVHIGDIQRISNGELRSLVADHDAVVYAAAAAVYSPLKSDTTSFYNAANVEPVVRLLETARDAVCDRAVLLGSYYATLHRQHPKLHLPDGSPYIQSRINQSQQAHQAAGSTISLTVLEIPYVLGATPGRPSALDPHMLRMRHGKGPLVYPGGTAVASVTEIADATVAALEKRINGNFPIATANLTWADLLRRLASAGDLAPKRVWRLTAREVALLFHWREIQRRRQGIRLGFNTLKIGSLHTAQAYVDLDVACAALGITHADINQAIRDTALASIT